MAAVYSHCTAVLPFFCPQLPSLKPPWGSKNLGNVLSCHDETVLHNFITEPRQLLGQKAVSGPFITEEDLKVCICICILPDIVSKGHGGIVLIAVHRNKEGKKKTPGQLVPLES